MDRRPAYPPRPSRRLALWLAAVNVLLLGLVVWLTAQSLHDQHRADVNRARESTENLAASLAIEIGAELKQVDNALATIALQYRRSRTAAAAVTGARTGNDNDELRRGIERVIADQRGLLPQVDTIRIVNAEGDVIFGLAAEEHSVNVADREYFRAARQSDAMVISEPLYGRILKVWGLLLARRLEDERGQFAGIVYTNLSSEHFLATFRRLAVGNEGAISLRTRSLRLVARHSAAEPQSTRGVGEVVVSEELRRTMAVNPTQGWYLTRTMMDDIERVTAYRAVRGYPMTIFTGASTGDFLSQWRGDLLRQILLAVIVVLTAAAASVTIWRAAVRERRAALELERMAALSDRLAMPDPLTGLPNRVCFEQRLAGALALLGEHGGRLAVGHVVLDGLPALRAEGGPAAVDTIRRETARRLVDGLRADDQVAPLDDGAFALMLPSARGETDLRPPLLRLLAQLRQPVTLATGREVHVEARIGIAFAPRHGKDVDSLLRRAAGALLQSRGDGSRLVASVAIAEDPPPPEVDAAPPQEDAIAMTRSPAPAPTPPAPPRRPSAPGPVPDHAFDESVAGEEDPGAGLDEGDNRVPPAKDTPRA